MTSAKLEDAFLALTAHRSNSMTSTAPSGRPPVRRLPPAAALHPHSALLTAKNFSFVIFAVDHAGAPCTWCSPRCTATPDDGTGVNWSAMIMVSMAAYGSSARR